MQMIVFIFRSQQDRQSHALAAAAGGVGGALSGRAGSGTFESRPELEELGFGRRG